MYLADWLASRPASLLTLTLAHFLWQGALVAALLQLWVTLSGIRAARSRYASSLVAFALLTAFPLVTYVWLAFQANLFSESAWSGSSIPALLWSDPTGSVGIAHPTGNAPSVWLGLIQPLALTAWITGVVLLALRLSVGACGIARLRRTRQALPVELTMRIEKLVRRLGLPKRPLVFLSADVSEAMALGIVRPFVLLPAAWLSEMPVELLEAVIAHELSHLRRHDLAINLLQRIAETLLFYHPAVWWLSRRLRVERELCADELAVEATGERLVYAQALERVAARRQAFVRPALAAFLRGEENMRLLERVQAVLGRNPGDQSRLWPAGLLTLALPLALWAASVGFFGPLSRVAMADDEPRAGFRREEEDDDDDRPAKRVGGDRGNRNEDERGDRQSTERKTIRKDGDRQIVVELDVDRPIVDVELKEKNPLVRKPGVMRKEYQVVPKQEGEDLRLEELLGMVKQLSVRVERLQAEVATLRGEKRAEAGDAPAKYRTTRSTDESGKEQIKQRATTSEPRSADQKKQPIKEKQKDPASKEKEAAGLEAIEQKIRSLGDLKKLDALKFADIDIKALTEKQVAEAERQSAKAQEMAERVKHQALEAVQRAMEQKKLNVERETDAKPKPAKKKPIEKDVDEEEDLKPSLPEQG